MLELERFKKAIKETSPVPCDDCRYFEMCKLNRLACTEFKSYVNKSDVPISRRPSRKVFNDIFADFGYQEQTWQVEQTEYD